MTPALRAFVAGRLGTHVGPGIVSAAAMIAERLGGAAVLFYGSVLRTGDLDGVIDFYVLTDGIAGHGLRAIGTRWLWPDVSFQEVCVDGRTIRCKVATMPLHIFARAAAGRSLDTTVWARFVQPAALVWASGDDVRDTVTEAVATAAITAARFAAVVGPRSGDALQFWQRLFQETYTAELRVERPGREEQILGYDRQHYQDLLPLAWRAGGIDHQRRGSALVPLLNSTLCRQACEAWLLRQRSGKLLNIARLVKASFTFDGAARYALWKLERHTGVHVALTPWRERHPLLAAPGVLFHVWRSGKVA